MGRKAENWEIDGGVSETKDLHWSGLQYMRHKGGTEHRTRTGNGGKSRGKRQDADLCTAQILPLCHLLTSGLISRVRSRGCSWVRKLRLRHRESPVPLQEPAQGWHDWQVSMQSRTLDSGPQRTPQYRHHVFTTLLSRTYQTSFSLR